MGDKAPPSASPLPAPLFSLTPLPPVQRLWRDPLLLGAFLMVGLMAGFQLTIHLLQPPWIGVVNDWLLAILAWLELLALVGLSWWLRGAHRPEARAWWLLCAVLCCFAIGRTLLLTGDPPLIPALLPGLRWSHLFALLQTLCTFLAILLLPTTSPHSQHALLRQRVFLDCLLLMSAVTLLCWDFLLKPLYLQRGPALAERATNLAYVVVNLGMLFILIVLLTRERRLKLDHVVLGLLGLAVLLVLIGNFWFVLLGLHTRHATSAPPDAFWILGSLLIPLAGLVQVRLAQWEGSPHSAPKVARVQWQDLRDCLRFMLPFIVPLLASIITILEAFLAPTLWGTPSQHSS